MEADLVSFPRKAATLLPNEDCYSVLLDKVIDLESDDNLYCWKKQCNGCIKSCQSKASLKKQEPIWEEEFKIKIDTDFNKMYTV